MFGVSRAAIVQLPEDGPTEHMTTPRGPKDGGGLPVAK